MQRSSFPSSVQASLADFGQQFCYCILQPKGHSRRCPCRPAPHRPGRSMRGPLGKEPQRSTTSAAFQKNGRQGTSTESPLMPTQPPPGPWDLVGG